MNTGSNLREQLLAIRPEPDISRPENAYGDGYVEGFWDAVARYKGAISELLPAVGGESSNTTTQDEWRPIETAPKDGTCILATRLYHIPDVMQWVHPMKLPFGKWRRRAGAWDKSGNPHFEPTHWMPLPEPPAEGSEL